MAWLRAQLDEDEQVAREATTGPWRHNPNGHWRKPGTTWFEEAVFAGPVGADATCIAGTGQSDDPQSMADAGHIARWDPTRVLAEVDAKRRMLDWCDRMTLVDGAGGLMARDARVFRRLLAQPYAERDGYREEWRPHAS